MKPEEVTIHLFDAARPDDDDNVYPIQVYSPVFPRVGDYVYYWVDYPRHTKNGHKCQEGEPVTIEGIVSKVQIEYRRMRWNNRQNDVTMVLVYLDEYTAKLPDSD